MDKIRGEKDRVKKSSSTETLSSTMGWGRLRLGMPFGESGGRSLRGRYGAEKEVSPKKGKKREKGRGMDGNDLPGRNFLKVSKLAREGRWKKARKLRGILVRRVVGGKRGLGRKAGNFGDA